MAEEILFPQRKRCKVCRIGLGLSANQPVLNGIYCSWRCAGLAKPATSPANAPRQCRTFRHGEWVWKQRYRSAAEIPDKVANDPSVNRYWCNHCGHLHIGHSRLSAREKFVMLPDRPRLATTLVKLRGRATRKEIAAAAGIRPIRLKELESPTGPFDVAALFAVLAHYRVKIGFSLPVSED